MHRRLFLRAARWSLLLVLSTLSLVLADLRSNAGAATVKTKPAAQGGLIAVGAEGNPVGQCPLKHTTVKAQVTGFLSRVTVTQEFENPFPDKIEAVYSFPLPQAAAVDSMTMQIGERVVRGRIMRREQAQAAYEAARTAGHIAALLDQQRPNIFTQSVANILPGQQVTVRISYVETLKYEGGTYEFSFPMTVGERYVPAAGAASSPVATDGAPAPGVTPTSSVNANAEATAAASLNPPVASEGMRAGHDISLEVMLDAGLPLDSLASTTHEIEVERKGERAAVVRLKNQQEIPNRDFVLKYDVAGRSIEEAVLTHRDQRGGYFTLILQPPERVSQQDVTPKELVFVLDTSGSMAGFPIAKAKETMRLALEGLRPYDTFNLITFAGDTHVLFPEPVAATPENLKKAQEFLESRSGGGGTEMMKAVRTALEPSDSQTHVRIVCFMTDGYVGNDMEIIGEVQKHPNARVFSFGIGSSVNRFLLDKMAEYGRGEVEYVTPNDDGSAAARRFHERVRDPLLTDIQIQWGGLPVADVYPRRIPDLFSAKPLVLVGRYNGGGGGVIHLRGTMAGQVWERDVEVVLPEAVSAAQPAGDVLTDEEVQQAGVQRGSSVALASLWARRRVDDLMGEEWAGMQSGQTKREDIKEEVTQMGLDYGLMTQYTSFVAVEERTVTDGGVPRHVDVPVERPAYTGAGGVQETVTVMSGSALACAASVVTTDSRNAFSLPLKGRSLQGLVSLAPSVNASDGGGNAPAAQHMQVSVNGQRPHSNSFVIDGVSANVGIEPGGRSPSTSPAGTHAGTTAWGGTNGLVSLEAVQELSINTLPFEAQYGRVPGAQVSITTRTGTNDFHGSLFESFGDDRFDAGDWFAGSRRLARPPRRQHIFGGTFSGPLNRDETFFFFSYEGARLRQPVAALTDVPSLETRSGAPAALRPFLNAFPLPNGAARPRGFAEFAGAYANPAHHSAASLRLDQQIDGRIYLSARYNFATSEAEERAAGFFSLNTLNKLRNRTQTLTGSASYTLTPDTVLEVKGNYSRYRLSSAFRLDAFGGASMPVADEAFSSLFGAGTAAAQFDLNGRNAALSVSEDTASVQRQFNLTGRLTNVTGNHTLRFGADIRRLSPIINLHPTERSVLFNGAAASLAGVASRLSLLTRVPRQQPVFRDFSLYAQDDWRITPRLTLTYGLRWELNPAPTTDDEVEPFAVNGLEDPARLSLAPRGTRLWRTTFDNFAPRASVAYQLSNESGRELVLRGGIGLFYDTGQEQAGFVYGDSQPFLRGRTLFDTAFPRAFDETPTNAGAPLIGFDPKLKLPYAWLWQTSVEQVLGYGQTITVSYIGAAGRRLLLTETLLGRSPEFPFARLTTNGATSDYHALQLEFNRRYANRLHVHASYTLSKSLDTVTQDSPAETLLRSPSARDERGPSDFDVRHQVKSAVIYSLPTAPLGDAGRALLRNWVLESVFNARSARPVNVLYRVPSLYGFASLRPDLISGVPLYVEDARLAGGRRINPSAFSVPAEMRQGTLGRNSLRGFPLYQLDVALRRSFELSEDINLQFRVEAFNVFNHPNFADPVAGDTVLGSRLSNGSDFLANSTFGESASLYGRSVHGATGRSFASASGVGGPRTLQFSLKFQF